MNDAKAIPDNNENGIRRQLTQIAQSKIYRVGIVILP